MTNDLSLGDLKITLRTLEDQPVSAKFELPDGSVVTRPFPGSGELNMKLGLGLSLVHQSGVGGGGATAPVNSVLPVISGTPTSGETLSTTNGTWDDGGAEISGYTYQWLDDEVAISGATASTFLLTDTQIGAVITVTVTATNAAGSTAATSEGTAAVAAAPVFGTLNQLDKSANIALSNGDLTATKTTDAAWASVRSTTSRSSGKYYFEWTADELTPGLAYIAAGFAAAAASVDNFLGADANGISLVSDGSVFKSGAGTATLAALAKADIIGFAIDIDAGLFWCRNGAGNWNGSGTANPATGAGGIAVPAGMSGVAIFAGLSVTSQNTSGTANLGATAFNQAAPSGFSDWGHQAAGALSASFINSYEDLTASSTTRTMIGCDFGDADADRIIAIQISAQMASGNSSFSSVTIGGVTATQIAFRTHATRLCMVGIFAAQVPSGTTGTVVITTPVNCQKATIGVHRLVGYSMTPHATDATNADNSATITNTVDISANGYAIAALSNRFAQTVSAITGGTSDYDLASSAVSTNASRHSGANYSSVSLQAAHVIDYDYSTLDTIVMCSGSFAPV